jgi:hypothetical protein
VCRRRSRSRPHRTPEILKQIAPDYLTTRKSEIKEIKEKDGLGNERTRLVAVNPYDNSTRDVTPQNSGGHAAGVPGAGGFDGNQMFSRGVTMDNFDHNKVGADYLAQFSPEMQAAVNAYRRGGTLPTGRQQQAQVIKQIAQKYGEDIGDPVDDQTYRQRNEWATSLANTKSGVGLASKGFQQGLQHMAQLSDKLVEKGNYGGFGLEPVAETENWVRNLSTAPAGHPARHPDQRRQPVRRNRQAVQRLVRRRRERASRDGRPLRQSDHVRTGRSRRARSCIGVVPGRPDASRSAPRSAIPAR